MISRDLSFYHLDNNDDVDDDGGGGGGGGGVRGGVCCWSLRWGGGGRGYKVEHYRSERAQIKARGLNT